MGSFGRWWLQLAAVGMCWTGGKGGLVGSSRRGGYCHILPQSLR